MKLYKLGQINELAQCCRWCWIILPLVNFKKGTLSSDPSFPQRQCVDNHLFYTNVIPQECYTYLYEAKDENDGQQNWDTSAWNLFFVKMVNYILKITFWENIRKILKLTSSQIMEVVANETLMSLTVV